MEPAAGIIPYIKINGTIYFLLGFEKNKWSGFVGGKEINDATIEDTALREFNEETAGVFINNLNYIKNEITSNRALLIPGNTKNRLVYLWFVKLPERVVNINVPYLFLEKLKTVTENCYREKSKLDWFPIESINKIKIMYKLKTAILNNYQNMI